MNEKIKDFIAELMSSEHRLLQNDEEYKKGWMDAGEEIMSFLSKQSTCQHYWIKLSPINSGNQKYMCLNCDEVKP